jgi:hypothetical protein
LIELLDNRVCFFVVEVEDSFATASTSVLNTDVYRLNTGVEKVSSEVEIGSGIRCGHFGLR